MKTITIAGRLTRDAEIKHVEQGQPSRTVFSVAVDHRARQNGQWTSEPMFFDCTWFGQRGERVAQYLLKGTPVCVCGEFAARQYQKRDRTTGLSLAIRVAEVTLLGSRREAATGGGSGGGGRYAGQGPANPPAATGGDDEFDDLPF